MPNLALIFALVSQNLSLPMGLLSAICYVESSHDIKAIHKNDGKGDSLGVCQIKVATAHLLGFEGGPKVLQQPSDNVYYAGRYLQYQLDRYDGNIPKAIAAYNSGTCSMKPHPQCLSNRKYVDKVVTAWLEGR